MASNRVFYDSDSLVVVAVHPVEQVVAAAAYEVDERSISTLVADAEDVPGVMMELREEVRDEAGNVMRGSDGKPLQGRIVGYAPRVLSAEWIEEHVAPLQETIDSTEGKLALLEADHLDAITTALEAISDPKEKMAAQLRFGAPTWSRSDPLWNKLAKSAKIASPTKSMDDIWRAAVAA